MTPFYRRLPQPYGITVETTADKVGLAVTIATVGGILVHTVARLLRRKKKPTEVPKAEPKTEWKGPEWHE
jgi:Ni,Fe-hydrogenase I small subunit